MIEEVPPPMPRPRGRDRFPAAFVRPCRSLPAGRAAPLLLLLALAAGPAAGYEEYSRREGLRCEVCHVSDTDRSLTARGEEYVRNGYSFRTTPAPSPTVRSGGDSPGGARSPEEVRPLTRLMLRSREALGVTVSAVAEGRYRAAIEGAKVLQDLAGRLEGKLRADRRAVSDQARLMRQHAFKLERSLRQGGRRRVALAPIQLGQVLGTCLSCHAAEGMTEEAFRAPGPPGPGSRRAPDSSLPRRARNSSGSRR